MWRSDGSDNPAQQSTRVQHGIPFPRHLHNNSMSRSVRFRSDTDFLPQPIQAHFVQNPTHSNRFCRMNNAQVSHWQSVGNVLCLTQNRPVQNKAIKMSRVVAHCSREPGARGDGTVHTDPALQCCGDAPRSRGRRLCWPLRSSSQSRTSSSPSTGAWKIHQLLFQILNQQSSHGWLKSENFCTSPVCRLSSGQGVLNNNTTQLDH